MKLLQNKQYLLVSFFLLTLVIILNLPIPMKYKMSLILVGIVLCFYQPKFILPFLTSIIVVYLSNRKISKLRKPNNQKSNIRESFFDAKTDFLTKMNGVNDFNYRDLISNTDISKLKNGDIVIQNNDREKVLKTNFLKECFQIYFFEFPQDFTLVLQLNLIYSKVSDLKKAFEFTDISTSIGYNDDPFRNNSVSLIGKNTLLKLGLLVHESKFLNIRRYFLKIISDYGLYSIMNKTYILDDESTNSEPIFEEVKKNIYEITILVFYLTYQESDKSFDFNQTLELDNLSLFDIIPKYITNLKLEDNNVNKDITYDKLLAKIKAINITLIDDRKLFPEKSMLSDILSDDSDTRNIDESLNDNSSVNKLEEKLNLFFNLLDEYLDRIKLIDISIYRVTNRKERRNQEFEIKANYLLLLLMTGYANDLFNLLTKTTENNEGENIFTSLAKNNKLLYAKKQARFQLQVQNELTIQEKYNFTGIQDIFYDTFYFYYGIYSNQSNIYKRNFIYPETKTTTPSVSPAPSSANVSVNTLSDYQQKNFELDLDEYLDSNSLKEKQEEALNKYYQFLDKENYEKVKGLNQLAENRNQELKIKELSFNNIIDNFGKEVFEIIDELVLVSKKFYLNHDLTEILSNTNSNLYNPTFESFTSQSPYVSPPPSAYQNMSKFDKYILFVKVILDILLRQNRIIYTGFIFIVLALLIYFIDSGESKNVESSGVKSIFDLLKL